jgi:O-antigen biosynthesis protein
MNMLSPSCSGFKEFAASGVLTLMKAVKQFCRYPFTFDLIPGNDLEKIPGKTGAWHSTGTNPFFTLVPHNQQYPSGWVYMESSIDRKGSNFTAHLYVDSGNGYSEQTGIAIPATRKGKVKHVFRLPKYVRELRWAPMQSAGIINHTPIVICKISQFERIIRMFLWVSFDLWKFRKSSQMRNHGLSLATLLFNLQGAYGASAKLRFNFAPPSYEAFIKKYDTLHEADTTAIQEHMKVFRHKPLISVIMPVYNTPERFLLRAIESVRNQLYPHWELCIADDASTQAEVGSVLERYQSDSRIKVVCRSEHGCVSTTNNSALRVATGDYIAVLDPRDELASHALYYVAVEVNQHPDVDLIYSDEDKIDDEGRRHDPVFKCDWNPDLFYSCNYIANFGVYRRSILTQIGGFRKAYEEAQAYDVALRLIKKIPHAHIRHIPVVIYHCRSSKDTELFERLERNCALDASLRALADHFKGKKMRAIKEGLLPNTYHVQYPLPQKPPKVSLLIPTRDGFEILQTCIESIRNKTSYPDWEIIVLNNQSQDKQTLSYLGEIVKDNRCRVVDYNLPFNFSAINNFGVKLATGDIVGFLNNDVEVINQDWLTEMVSHAVRPGIGAVGAKLYYADGFVQHAGVIIGLGGLAGHAHRLFPGDHPGYAGRAMLTQNFSAVTAACMVVKREVFDVVGGMDEVHLTVAYNDVDLCLRIQDAGYRNVWTPYAELYHSESYTRGDDNDSAKKRSRLNAEKKYILRRWHTCRTPDPYYSPNLTLDKEDFSIAHDPRVTVPWAPFLKVSS